MKHALLLTVLFFTLNSINAQNLSSFSVKKSTNLPEWFSNAETTYTLNDERVVDYEDVQFIGGVNSEKGEIFFIDNKEIVFNESQIKIIKLKNIITKTLSFGDYRVKITFDTNSKTGAYTDGQISLFYKGMLQNKSRIYINGY